MKTVLKPEQIRTALVMAAAVCAVCAGFFLPSVVMQVGDGRSEYVTETVELNQNGASFSLIDRLRLVDSSESSIRIDGGEHFADENSAFSQAMDELESLNTLMASYGAGALGSSTAGLTGSQVRVTTGESGISAVIWELDISTADNLQLNLLLDDETGKIISMYRSVYSDAVISFDSEIVGTMQDDVEGKIENKTAIAIASAFADYLSLELRSVELNQSSDYGGVYTVTVSDGESTAGLVLELSDNEWRIN